MTLAVVEHIHHILVGHSDRAPLIVTGRAELNHLPPIFLIFGFKKLVPCVVQPFNGFPKINCIFRNQMFHGKIFNGKFLCGDFVHGGTGISSRAYLIGIKLFPPVQRGGDVHSNKNLP